MALLTGCWAVVVAHEEGPDAHPSLAGGFRGRTCPPEASSGAAGVLTLLHAPEEPSASAQLSISLAFTSRWLESQKCGFCTHRLWF